MDSYFQQKSKSKSKSNDYLLWIGGVGVGGIMFVILIVIIFSSFRTSSPESSLAATNLAATISKTCCPSNYIKEGENCWELCSDGKKFVSGECIRECPAGYNDTGGICLIKPDTYNKGCCCNDDTKDCCNNCKDGYIDNGCICNHLGSAIIKNNYKPKSIAATPC